jgi:hypothetical protein
MKFGSKWSMLDVDYTYLTLFDHRLGHCALKGARVRQYEPYTTVCNNMAERCSSEKMLFMTKLAVIFLRRGSPNAICNACTEHARAQSLRVSTRDTVIFHTSYTFKTASYPGSLVINSVQSSV